MLELFSQFWVCRPINYSLRLRLVELKSVYVLRIPSLESLFCNKKNPMHLFEILDMI